MMNFNSFLKERGFTSFLKERGLASFLGLDTKKRLTIKKTNSSQSQMNQVRKVLTEGKLIVMVRS